MSERLKKIVGDDLYSKIEEAANAANIKIKDIDVVANNFVPKGRFDEVKEKLKSTEGKIGTYDNQLKEIENVLKSVNSENVGDLIGKFNSMKDTHAQELSLKDKEILNIKKVSMIKEGLINKGAKHVNLLLKEIDIDKISLENDKILGLTDVVKGLKENYSDLFIEKKSDSNPPANTNNTSNSGNNDKLGVFSGLLQSNKL